MSESIFPKEVNQEMKKELLSHCTNKDVLDSISRQEVYKIVLKDVETLNHWGLDYTQIKYLNKIIKLDNGAHYLGEWNVKTGIIEGRGAKVWVDGSFYEGYWVNGICHGEGRLYQFNGDVYEGELNYDLAHGKGKLTYSDGSIYKGDWAEDV